MVGTEACPCCVYMLAGLEYDWHCSCNLVSNTPLAFGSVAERHRQMVEEGAHDNQEIIRRMSQRLRSDEHYLANAYMQTGLKHQSSG